MSMEPSSNNPVPEEIAGHIAELRRAVGAVFEKHPPGWYARRFNVPHWLDTPEKAACGRYVNSMGWELRPEAPADACPNCLEWLRLRALPKAGPDRERRRAISEQLRAMGLEVPPDGY